MMKPVPAATQNELAEAHEPHPPLNPLGIPVLKIDRDLQGRFRPGNPFARKVAALRQALLDSVSEQDLKEMIEALKLTWHISDQQVSVEEAAPWLRSLRYVCEACSTNRWPHLAVRPE
jgi:hypothetical protein